MSLDELLGLLFMLYILGSVLSALLRRDGGRGTAQGHDEGELTDWEKELEELFRRHRESHPSSGERQPADERPWLEVEPIPPWEGPESLPPGQDRQPRGEGAPPSGAPPQPEPFPGEPWPAESPEEPWPAEEQPRREPAGETPRPKREEEPQPQEPALPVPRARSQRVEPADGAQLPRPIPRPSVAPPPADSRPEERQALPAGARRSPWQRIRGEAGSWREAIILREILDEPRALRPYRPLRGFWWTRPRR